MKTFKNLKDKAADYTSQHGENGILEEMLRILEIDSGRLVEFGAGDGIFCSNTYFLVESGKWEALYIEPYEDFKKLKNLGKKHKNLKTLEMVVNTKSMSEYVKGSSLDEICSKYMPDPDIVSIDVDSFDYYIFREMEMRPKIVIIEINPYFDENVRYVDRWKPNVYGTSFLSMKELGIKKGYMPVLHVGTNIFFVRNDVVEGIEVPEIEFDGRYLC